MLLGVLGAKGRLGMPLRAWGGHAEGVGRLVYTLEGRSSFGRS